MPGPGTGTGPGPDLVPSLFHFRFLHLLDGRDPESLLRATPRDFGILQISGVVVTSWLVKDFPLERPCS